mmetsp:Transcript_35516/g.92847  ORF Transcript_35516/g.92847 Transcript_35516/m.92847 type:complete len:162 (-) Transcript_35516:106-591(-)
MHEHRVAFVSASVSESSAAALGILALLAPLTWDPHVLLPVVPTELQEVMLDAVVPFVLGLQGDASTILAKAGILEDDSSPLIIVDLDRDEIIRVGQVEQGEIFNKENLLKELEAALRVAPPGPVFGSVNSSRWVPWRSARAAPVQRLPMTRGRCHRAVCAV